MFQYELHQAGKKAEQSCLKQTLPFESYIILALEDKNTFRKSMLRPAIHEQLSAPGAAG